MTLDASLRYADAGFSIFPVRPRGKAPDGRLVPNGYHGATTDPTTIRDWWRAEPRCNIGLPCRPNGLVVLDEDPRNGGDLDALPFALPHTPTQQTGGGGRHLIFRDPGEKLPGKVADGIDVKANGYVVIAPSLHPSGELYRWIYHLLDTPLADLPNEIRRLAEPQSRHDTPPRPANGVWSEENIRDALSYIPPHPEHDLWIRVIAAVYDATGRDAGAAQRLLKAWSPEDEEGEYAYKLRNGLDRVTAGTLHHLATQHGWTPPTQNGRGHSRGEGPRSARSADRESTATRLVNLVGARCDLFHSERSMPFAQRHADGVCMHLGSERFDQWVSDVFFEITGRVLPSAALRDAVTTFKGQAMRAHREVHVRTCGSIADGVVYVALSRTRVVRVTSDVIEVIPATEAAVPFWLPAAAEDLPEPDLSGTLDDIGRALDLSGEALLIAGGWMLTVYLPGGPYPLLSVFGPQGAGKSTRCRLIVLSLDPATLVLRTAPKSEDDLIVAARSCHIMAFDNLSKMSDWLSDSLCRVATGGGIAKRKLYSDLSQVVVSVKRPLIINAIVDVVRRSDLADRIMLLELSRLDQRLTERQVKARFERLRPKVLGAVLKGVQGALRDFDQIELPDLPRMADACLWAEAGLRGLGAEPLAFYRAFTKAGEDAARSIVEGDLVGSLAVTIAGRGGFTGTATELLRRMREMASGQQRSLPPDATRLSGELRRIDPAIRTAFDWGLAFMRESGTGRRLVKIPDTSASPASRVSRSARTEAESDAGDAGDTSSGETISEVNPYEDEMEVIET